MQTFDENSLIELEHDVGFCTRNLLHLECTVRMAGRFSEELEAVRRALGIHQLLLRADSDSFARALVHGGYARRYYLSRAAKERFDDYSMCASRAESFFDALAARQFDLAREIASLSPKAWRPNEEYEDDFCFAHFLHGVLLATDSLAPILEQFELSLEGASTPRFAVCSALLDKDRTGFTQAFEQLLEERAEEAEQERIGQGEEDVRVAVGTLVFVEGLALLSLAENLGWKMPGDYTMCPALARQMSLSPAPNDELPRF